MIARKGSTLIELMLTIATVALVAAGGVAVLSGGCGNQQADAKTTAREYAHELGIDIGAVSCTTRDTDGDGYLGCTIMHKDPSLPPLMVECTGSWTYNHGCRAPKASMRGY